MDKKVDIYRRLESPLIQTAISKIFNLQMLLLNRKFTLGFISIFILNFSLLGCLDQTNLSNTAQSLLLVDSLKLSVQQKQFPSAASAAWSLYLAKKKAGRFEEALHYHEQYLDFKDSILSEEKARIAYILTVQYKIHEKEEQISRLKQEQLRIKQQYWWISGASFLLLSTGFMIYKLRGEKELHRMEAVKKSAETQALLLRKQLDVQHLALQAKRAQLEDYAQMLIDRNQQLNELTQKIELIHAANASKSNGHVESLFNQVILTDTDWEKFQDYFNNVFPGFIAELRKQYQDLSPSETRLVLLDKMGLSLKESSAILGISIDAVKKGRYRLKKKYNLG